MNRRAALGLMLAALAGAPALAHRGHASLAIVVIDRAAGQVRVSHRFAAHDIEPALVAIAPDAAPSLDDPAALAALVAYVGRQFRLQGVTLAAGPPRLAGDDVILDLAGPLPRRLKSLTVTASLFGETHSDFSVQVNVRDGGATRTLQFHPGDGAKTLALDAK